MQKTILVVEDDIDIRSFLKKALTTNNFKVFEAGDGAEALEAVEKYLPNLILLDFGLPKVSGETVCVKVKKNHPEIIIIALTEKTSSSDVVHGLQIGADDYISKPFVAEEVIARIDARFKTAVKGQSELQEKDVNNDQIGEDESKAKTIILRESIVLVMMRIIFTETIFGLSVLMLNIAFSYLSSNTNIISLSSLYFTVFAGCLLINIGIVIMIISKWNSEYTSFSKGIVIKHSGILHKKEQTYACNFVEGAKLDQSLFGILFDYGTIELYDPALKEQVYLVNIAKPKKYSVMVQNIVLKEKDKPMPFIAPDNKQE